MRKVLMMSVAVLGLQAVPAHAGPIAPAATITGVAVQGDTVTIKKNHPVAYDITVTAGPLTLTTSMGAKLVAWCVDLFHGIQTGTGQSLQYTVGALTTDSSPKPAMLTAAQLMDIGRLANYGQSLLDTGKATNDALAAVQLAIWSAEYSNLMYTGLDSNLVSNAKAASASFSGTDYALLAQGGTQSFVVAGSYPTGTPVPEPTSLALAAGGLALMAGLRRRAGHPA